MENRIYNFNPGPAMQPLEVLQEAQAEFLNFAKSGMSIIEISHRSKQYEQVHNQAKSRYKKSLWVLVMIMKYYSAKVEQVCNLL